MNIIQYPGSKDNLSATIISYFPRHKLYVEVFGGSGAVLFNKQPSEIEVYNDLDENLAVLFRVLRDPEKSKLLYELIRMTLYSRAEFELSQTKITAHKFISDIDHALSVFLTYNLSYGGIIHHRREKDTASFGYSRTTSKAAQYRRRVNSIPETARRLEQVIIEQLDFRELIERYDSPDTLFYIDPPYIGTSRAKGTDYYRVDDLTAGMHIGLLEHMRKLQGAAIISGYSNKEYAPLEKELNWRVKEIEVRASLVGSHATRTEVLWISPKCVAEKKQLSLGLQSQF